MSLSLGSGQEPPFEGPGPQAGQWQTGYLKWSRGGVCSLHFHHSPPDGLQNSQQVSGTLGAGGVIAVQGQTEPVPKTKLKLYVV